MDQLIADNKKPEDLIGENALLKRPSKELVECALDTESTANLGHKLYDDGCNAAGNVRDGRTQKTITGEFGVVDIENHRDCAGTFRPQLIGKHQRRFAGFDEPILSLCARGMSSHEIEAHVRLKKAREDCTTHVVMSPLSVTARCILASSLGGN